MIEPSVHIHFVSEETNRIVTRQFANHVPRVGDEIRLGGPKKERYYKVTRVVWVYDEPESPFYRANVGVADAA